MKKIILIIEDNSGILEEIALLLQFSDYKVLNANNGKSALKLLENNNPDIIISDLYMPYINGLEILHKIRSDKKKLNLPFILMTAYNSKIKNLPYIGKHVTRVLSKPFTSEDLLDTIISLLQMSKNYSLKDSYSC